MIIQNDHYSCVPTACINLAKLYRLPLTKKHDLKWLMEVLECSPEQGTPWASFAKCVELSLPDIFHYTPIEWGLDYNKFKNMMSLFKTSFLCYGSSNGSKQDVHCVLVYYDNGTFYIYNYYDSLRERFYPVKEFSEDNMKALLNSNINRMPCAIYMMPK